MKRAIEALCIDLTSAASSIKMADDTESNYFNNYPPPKALQKHETLARAFVELQVEKKRRVVLVTSGGTTVPVCALLHASIQNQS